MTKQGGGISLAIQQPQHFSKHLNNSNGKEL